MPFMDIRGAIRGAFAGARGEAQLNDENDVLMAQGFPPFTELTRQGNSWTTAFCAASAPVAGLPTTTAMLEVYNNLGAADGRSLIVTDLYGFQLLSTAATQTYALWAMVSTQKAIPTLTALDLFSSSGKGKLTPTATSPIVTGAGTTVIANGWRPYGPVQAWGTAAALPGNSLYAPIDGKLIVPPGCSVCIQVAGTIATASSFQVAVGFALAKLSVPMQ